MPSKTNVTINHKQYYRTTVTVGKNPDGAAIRKQFYGKTKREAHSKRDAYLQKVQTGLIPGSGTLKFGPHFHQWYQQVLCPGLSPSTVKRYEQEYRLRIAPSTLMDRLLSDIKSIHIQNLYNSLYAEGTSANSIRIIHNMLSSFFNYCIKTDVIVKNPLLAVQRPKDHKVINKKMNLTDEDIRKIVLYAQRHSEAFIFVFAIFTGLRQGEILALNYKDIENDFLNVNKTVHYLPENGQSGRHNYIISPAKTHKSIRQIPLFENILPMLRAHIDREKEKHCNRGVPFTSESILFSSQSCGYYNSRNLRKKLYRLYKHLDIEPTTFHGLRHTFCSVLARNGVNLKTASELMGHSNINTTLKIYTHVQKEEKQQGIATLISIFPKG